MNGFMFLSFFMPFSCPKNMERCISRPCGPSPDDERSLGDGDGANWKRNIFMLRIVCCSKMLKAIIAIAVRFLKDDFLSCKLCFSKRDVKSVKWKLFLVITTRLVFRCLQHSPTFSSQSIGSRRTPPRRTYAAANPMCFLSVPEASFDSFCKICWSQAPSEFLGKAIFSGWSDWVLKKCGCFLW